MDRYFYNLDIVSKKKSVQIPKYLLWFWKLLAKHILEIPKFLLTLDNIVPQVEVRIH